jgi:aminoglycoside phosphotransferase (APT) family kinase protein
VTITEDRISRLTEELLAVLRDHSGLASLEYAAPPAELTGGFWAELLTFRLEGAPEGWDGGLVARVMPNPDIAAKEAAFQREVADQGFPTPSVHLVRGPGAGVDGRALMVMDLAEGRPLLAGLDGVGAIAKLPSLARRLPSVLADVLARLHRLDPAPVEARLAEAVRPDVDTMLQQLEDTTDLVGAAPLADSIRWLVDHRPGGEPEVICHGDMHPFNVLVDGAGSPTVLDWSAAMLAPRTYDVAFTSVMLADPPLMAPGPLRPVIGAAGRALSRRFVRSYERQAGVRVDAASLAWHQGLIYGRALGEVAQWEAAGTLAERRGHPWMIAGGAMADRLRSLTGVPVAVENLITS